MKGKAKLIFSRRGPVEGYKPKKPFMGEVWIFFGTHHTYLITFEGVCRIRS